jgi:putative membrane-bound dehydrogenase-like protein
MMQSVRISLRSLIQATFVLAFILAPLATAAAQQAGRKIQVLFLGHDATHHPSDVALGLLAPALAKDGIEFTYTTNPDDLNPEKLAHFDALMLYANHDSITPSQEKALLDYVESGHGFLPIHSASHCFRNSQRYLSMIGGQFDKHGTGTFTAEIVKPNHEVMKGIQPFETWDETYIHKNNNPDRIVLMERVEGDHREAWTWVRTQGKGRVFYTAYGHDERTWKQPMFHAMLKNAIVWSVAPSVRAQFARLKMPVAQYQASSRIPNYERRNPPLQYQLPLPPAQSQMLAQVPPGFELQLFASEPDIAKPIAMAWDARGRLWIAETLDYPNDIHPGLPGRDKIVILEDTNHDGKADKFTVFAEGLNIPTGLVFVDGGVLVSQMPDLIFLKDTTGDDKADIRQVRNTGFGFKDTHAGPSNLRYGFDNRIWGAVGYSGYSAVQHGDSISFNQALWRMRPDGSDMEHVASFSNNTWGVGFNETFDIFGSTANNTHAVYVGIPNRYTAGVKGLPPRVGSAKIDGHYAMHPNTPNVRQVDVFGGFTAAAGFNVYTARTYPKEYWNRIAFVSEPTGRLLHRAILESKGAGYVEKDGWNMLASADDWTGPVDAQVGPDGNVWVVDWYNFIIQHNPTPAGFENGKGNAYENPLRDHRYGRIYRIVYKGAPAAKPMSLRADRPAELVRALTNDNLLWRMTAQRLLVERHNADVAPELIKLVKNRSVDELGLNPGALHALWTLKGLGQLDGSSPAATAAAVAAIDHPAAGVRKAAIQVLPVSASTFNAMQGYGVFEDRDPHTRLTAILMLADLPASDSIGALLYQLGKAPNVQNDEWLSLGVLVAAAHHRPAYLKAYASDVGATPFRELADRIAKEETTPPAPTEPGQRAGGQQVAGRPAAPPPPLPIGERFLHANVEDVVGPITRPSQFGARRGAGASAPAMELNVSVLKGQMKFSLPDFTVKPGQLVRLTLTNPDEMQHNMVIVRPGTLQAVGALADAMAATPDAAERSYVPPTPDVMWFTKLVDPGKSFTIEFTAPRQTGDYPYICTFPGHWRIMQGTMKVAE